MWMSKLAAAEKQTDRQTDRLNIDGPDRKTKKNQQIYKNGDKTQM